MATEAKKRKDAQTQLIDEERIVRLGGIDYRERIPDPVDPNKEIWVLRQAVRGQRVHLEHKGDLERGEKYGAFFESEEEAMAELSGSPAVTAAQEQADQEFSELSVDELETWIEEEEPTVDEVLERANGNMELAEKLLDAENRVTGNEPRKGVVEGLNRIIAREATG
jgi:hypothetical protein